MAVINLEGIKERGKFIKAQIDEQKRIEENTFWRRVETIRKSQKDCINFINTYKALCENGMKKRVGGMDVLSKEDKILLHGRWWLY